MSSAFPVENVRGRFAVPGVRCLPAFNKAIFLFYDNVGTPIVWGFERERERECVCERVCV